MCLLRLATSQLTMPTRGELISAGFAGLAGILDSSSEEGEGDEDSGFRVSSQAKSPLHTQSPTSRANGDNGVVHGAGELFPLLVVVRQHASKRIGSWQRGPNSSRVLSNSTSSQSR